MIRLAKLEDMARLLEIYTAARAFMRQNGNMTQWNGSYPDEQTLRSDIAKGQLYGMERKNADGLCGCFALIDGIEPTYHALIGGQWRSAAPYGTIHRIAGDGTEKGLFERCVQFARKRYDHLRVDTHEDNMPMRGAILKNGFQYRGVIYLADGTPRLAYDWLATSV